MIEEIWKDIPEYEGLYQISNLGRVRHINKYKHILYQKVDSYGYNAVILCKNGKIKYYRVHRLVGMSFIPNPNNYPFINHKDECKTNNIVDNLEWCDNKYNCNWGTRNKRISNALKSK